MATEKQVAANRRNAERSTGPKTEAGKARSRTNAIVHGLACATLALPDPEGKAEDRRRKWHAEIRPRTEMGCHALDLAVAASIRMDQCHDALDAIVVDQSTRAHLSWDGDRRAEAASLADGLSRRPERVAPQLETTRHGAELMIARWDRLGEAIEAEGDWNADEAAVALDLLGVPRALRRGRTPIDPAPGDDPRAFRMALARDEIGRLSAMKAEYLDAIDDLAREHGKLAAMAIISKPAQLVHRYERETWRRYRESMRLARALPDESAAPLAAPEPTPVVASIPFAIAEPAPDLAFPEPYPTEPDAIVALFDDIEARHLAAVTDDERRASRIEMRAAIAHYGPQPDVAPRPSAPAPAAAPHLNRQQRRALGARARRA